MPKVPKDKSTPISKIKIQMELLVEKHKALWGAGAFVVISEDSRLEKKEELSLRISALGMSLSTTTQHNLFMLHGGFVVLLKSRQFYTSFLFVHHKFPYFVLNIPLHS